MCIPAVVGVNKCYEKIKVDGIVGILEKNDIIEILSHN